MEFALTLDALAQSHKTPISFTMSVALPVRLPAYISAAPTEWIFLKLHTEDFYTKMHRENPNLL